MCSLLGLTATKAFNCGINSPISPVSTLSRTADISDSPKFVPESIKPG